MSTRAHDQAYRKLYNSARWRRERVAFLSIHPLCSRCMAMGIVEEAKVVHHMKAHQGDLELFWDQGNWEGLCKPHHDRHGQREDRGQTVVQFDESGWPVE